MCNLYSLTKGQAAIRDWFRASNDRTGNLPLFPGIVPDQKAPIVRNGADGERELVMARWGMPGPPRFGGAPITNIAMSVALTGADGLGRKIAASFRQLRFVSTPTRGRARRRSGLPSVRSGPCSPSLVYGPLGAACEGRRAHRWMGSMSCSVF
jgi:hypothetical protein